MSRPSGVPIAAAILAFSALPAFAQHSSAPTTDPGTTTVQQNGHAVTVTKATEGSNGGQGSMSDKGGPGMGHGSAGTSGVGGGSASAGNAGRMKAGGQ